MDTDTLDELAAFGQATDTEATRRAVTDLAERNPVVAVLAAAAAGAALMALAALMTRRAPDPLAPVPLVSSRGLDFESLRQQIADLADRLGRVTPVDAAKQRVEQAGDAISDGWSTLRDQAFDVLGSLEPQASAAVKVARDNPVLTALVVGAVGALVGSQLFTGKPAAALQDTDNGV